MQTFLSILVLFFMITMIQSARKTSSNISDSINFNQTYVIFVSKDAPIGHTQIIDTFDHSVCLMCSMNKSFSYPYKLPFELLLIRNEYCTLYLHVIRILDSQHISTYTIKHELFHENISIVIALSIHIVDMNDQAPKFEHKHYQFMVKENILPGTLIGRVRAHNTHMFIDRKISYTLFGNDLVRFDNRTMFAINADTGDIFLLDNKLNYDQKRKYHLIVEAKCYEDITTTTSRYVSTFADVIVIIEDMSSEQLKIIYTIVDADKDGGRVKVMNISKPRLNREQNHFINSFRSNIHLIENDAELVHMTKEEPLPANTLLTILHIRDNNDQLFNEYSSLSLKTYVQCLTNDILINNITYCLLQNVFYLSMFRPNVYGLFNVHVLDREQYENYIIHLIANNDSRTNNLRTPSHPLQKELFIYITMLDINDNAPVFSQTYFHLQIDENQPEHAILTRLQAFDMDKGINGTVQYELTALQQDLFSIGVNTGILRTNSKLDREICGFYRIGIRAHDLGYPQRKYSSIAIVDVQINNVNDNVPYFVHDIYHFNVEENASKGKVIGRLTIADKDEQEPIERMINLGATDDGDILPLHLTVPKQISRLDYSTVDFLFNDSYRNESSSGLFAIDSQGFIHTLAVLDREYQSTYSFHIFMYDRILKSYTLPTNVVIEIIDENDNIPYEPFLANSSVLFIEQDSDEETLIYRFQPIDPDADLNGLVSVECLNCTSTAYFHIINSSILIARSNMTIPDGIYSLSFMLHDHGQFISHKQYYTLTFNLTHRLKSTTNKSIFFIDSNNKTLLFISSWYYLILFLMAGFMLSLMASWKCYHYDRMSNRKHVQQFKTIRQTNGILTPTDRITLDLNDEYNNQNFDYNKISNNFHSIPIRNHLAGTSPRNSHCRLSTIIMNSRETILTDAATNTSYHQDNNDIWQPMNSTNNHNNGRILSENGNAPFRNQNYYFEPIDRDFSSHSTTSTQDNYAHLIQRPIPISNHQSNTIIECLPTQQEQCFLQSKRNSTMNFSQSSIDSTIRPYVLPRSVTTDQFSKNKNPPKRIYYYPSVQDVIDALNRNSNFKESIV